MTELSDLEPQRQRAAKNQSLFREVNERIEELAGGAAVPRFICECMNESCDESVELTVAEYEDVRSAGNRFFVLPGHEVGAVEDVVGSTDRFLIVSKRGLGGAVAERLDPRTRLGS
jgi:hypothetical protein